MGHSAPFSFCGAGVVEWLMARKFFRAVGFSGGIHSRRGGFSKTMEKHKGKPHQKVIQGMGHSAALKFGKFGGAVIVLSRLVSV